MTKVWSAEVKEILSGIQYKMGRKLDISIPDIIQNIYANIYKYTLTIMKSQQPDKIKS